MTEPLLAAQSYLLRLWRASSAGKPIWRASLVSVQTGERRGFADLEHLFAFLEGQTGGDVRPDDRRPSTEP